MALGLRAAAGAASRSGAPAPGLREAEAALAEFAAGLHAEAVRQLDGQVAALSARLRAAAGGPRDRAGLDAEARLYAELRELMSAREFAGQYGAGLA